MLKKPLFMGTSTACLPAAIRLALLVACALLNWYGIEGHAQVTNITSSGLRTTLNGSEVLPCAGSCDITGGTRPGGGTNLFHSFGQFDVRQTLGVNDIANFKNAGSYDSLGTLLSDGLPTNNIIGRVTDGFTSQIYGTLQTEGFGSAALWLINPAGVVFGATAQLNVGGSVHISTADYIKLSDGVQFNAVGPVDTALLTSASPAAFGFLTSAPAPITVDGSFLQVPADQTLSLVGGNIQMTGAFLQAPGGRIQVASVASPGEVTLFDPAPALTTGSGMAQGRIDLVNTFLEVGDGGFAGDGSSGAIVIRGGRLIMESSLLSADTFGAVNGDNPGLDLKIADDISLSNSSLDTRTFSDGRASDITIQANMLDLQLSTIASDTDQSFSGVPGGNAGDIFINVGRLSLTDSFVSSSSVFSAGKAGDIIVDATESVLLSGNGIFPAQISTTTTGTGTGNAGTIAITAPTVTLDGESVSSSTSGFGNAGTITLTAGTINLLNGAQISGATEFFGTTGNGGLITVSASNVVEIAGSGVVSGVMQASGITSASRSGSTGNAGQVVVSSPSIILSNGGIVSTSTETTGTGGAIQLNAGTVNLSSGANISSSSTGTATGAAGAVTIQGLASPAASVSLTDSALRTSADTTGQGGSITVDATDLTLNNASISASVKDFGSAPDSATTGLGNIVLTAPTMNMTGGTVTAATAGSRNAGSITITTTGNTLTMTGGARIEASTRGAGKAGDITINATNDVTVTGLSSDGQTRSGIFAKTQGSGAQAGAAGDIEINAKNVTLSGGAQFDSSTTSAGNGGSVSIIATDGITIAGTSTSLKSDSSRGNGQGGSIALQAKTIGIHDNASVTAATSGSGNAGNITMTAQQTLTLNTGATVTTGTRGSGTGGTIQIEAPQVLLDGPGTRVTADTLPPFADLSATLDILHTFDMDLTVRLDSPDGTRVALLSRVGGSGDDFTNTILDDQAGQPITSGSAPFTGMFRPREPLAQLIDQSVAGTWKLNVTDNATGGTGSLKGWSLRIGNEEFQSSNVPQPIPDIGSVSSNLVVAAPAGTVIQGVGEAAGIGGDIAINAGTVTVQNGATISSATTGTGKAGAVTINSTALNLNNATVTTSTSSSGNAGSITAKVGTATLSSATISSSSTGAATGNAGAVTIQGLASPADSVSLTNSSLLTSAANTGQGGNITVDATTLTLNNATISASVKDVGSAPDSATSGLGNIDLSASTLNMTGGTVTAASAGTRNAGNININRIEAPGSTFEMSGSSLTTAASLADGGNTNIYFDNMLRMTDSRITSSVGNPTKTDTTGGNITIDPQFVILQNSQILAQAFAGLGGNITIVAGALLVDPTSSISASSQLGISGSVDIRSPVSNVAGLVGRLPESVLEVQELLRAACAARLEQAQASSFVERGRDSIPSGPDGLLAGPFLPPSPEPQQTGAALFELERSGRADSIQTSSAQVRRLLGGDSSPGALVLLDESACRS